MDELREGRRIRDRYLLLRRSGLAGDAQRWIAVDETLRREVVLWVVPADHPHAQAVQDSARRAALVEDGRLPRVLDIGHESDRQFVVTQHDPRAHTLAELVAEGPLPPAEGRRLVGEAAATLEIARRHGVHHGALTPEHLLRDVDDGIVVTGLSVAAAVSGRKVPPGDEAALVDTRDLVALLHTAVTGGWPGSWPSAAPPAAREGQRLLPPREIAAHVPHDLDELCDRLVSDQPLELNGEPVRTPGDLARVLAPWNGQRVQGRGVLLRDEPATTRIRPVAGAAAGAVPLAAGSAATGAEEAAAEPAPAVEPPAGAAGEQGAGAGAAAGTGGRPVRVIRPEPGTEGSAHRRGLVGAGVAALLLLGGTALALQFSGSDDPDPEQAPVATSGTSDASSTTGTEGASGTGRDGETRSTGDDDTTTPGDEGEHSSSSAAERAAESTDGPAPEDPAQGRDDHRSSSEPQAGTDAWGEGDAAAPGPAGEQVPGQIPAGPRDPGEGPTTGSDDSGGDTAEDGGRDGAGDRGGGGGGSTTAPRTDPTTTWNPSPGRHDGSGAQRPERSRGKPSRPSQDNRPSTRPSGGWSNPGRPGPDGSPHPVHGWPIAMIEPWDPGHDGDEHSDWIHRINNPSTDQPWKTHQYAQRPFGGFTEALGLRVDLGQVRTISAVDIGMPQGAWTYEVRADSHGDVHGATVIGGRRGGGDVTWEVDEPLRARYVYVWFTDTAPTTDGRWYAALKEITVR